ncbi:MAG: carbohydrate ABC transporter permease [Oscillospiraceae bacterium]|jgi:multiple sugar transport system permease protein/putative aldouronate transport system permease protein|nr:carbohydrate ABC transporter permease [Oscillospiraceae bacterium]
MTARVTLRKRRRGIRQPWSDYVFDGISALLLVVAGLLVAYPLIYVVSSSLSSTSAVMGGRVWLYPVEPSLTAYKAVFENRQITTGYINSFVYTALGTILTLVVTMLSGFCLSRKDFFGRGAFSALLVFTMFFSGGLIPSYLLVRDLHMLNTIWVMVLPGAVSAWFIMLTRTYIKSSIPDELFESANLDGCTVYGMLAHIALPLSGSIIAVVGLYSAVGIWNGYFDAFIYLSDKKLYPLQVVLRNILILNQMDVAAVQDLRDLATRQGMSNLLKYAIIVVSSAPLLVLYPFVQKYFVKGVMIGSLKG